VEGGRLGEKVELRAELPGSEYAKFELLAVVGMFESVAVLQLAGGL